MQKGRLKPKFQTACYFKLRRITVCHQFSVYVFADIDLRGFKVEAVKLLLQPRFITLNDFEDVGVDLAVCNQRIA